MSDIDKLRQALGAVQPEEVEELLDRLEAAEKERDDLQAKVDQMERQEPVATIHINSITGNPSVDFIPGHRYLHHNSSLYALPGAQPQLNEIKITLQRALELGQRETWTGARKHRSWGDQREEQQCWNKVWSLLGAQGE